ncbi:hypothetical protein ABIE32_003633 [Comamonas sp. 4034]
MSLCTRISGDSAELRRNGDDSAVAIGGTDYGLANPLP